MQQEKAILAGGCFWGMQELIRKLPGILSTRVGYTGGEVPNATYRNHGDHAEAIEILFNPLQISYRMLLEFFFQIHDPSTPDRQGNDKGRSYRSEIFYTTKEQKEVALQTIKDVDISGLWPGKVVTAVTKASEFWEAEPEHQDYLQRFPDGYTCHFARADWVLSKRENMPYNKLNKEEKYVILNKGTERAFTGKFWDHKEDGKYVCRQCNADLFPSDAKFDSGTGWASFDDAVEGAVKEVPDADGRRVEIVCANCGGHLGHVFRGERMTKKSTRHCVNSLSLDFVAK